MSQSDSFIITEELEKDRGYVGIEQENRSRGRVRRRGCGVRVLILPNPQSYPLILS